MKTTKKVPFDIEKAKAGAKVVTNDGDDARIICFELNRKDYPIVAIINKDGGDVIRVYTTMGKALDGEETNEDLRIIEEVELFDRWRDKTDDILNGYYIGTSSSILFDAAGYTHDFSNRNVFVTEKQARSALAMAQLSQIMANDERFGGVVTDEEWQDKNITKYSLIRACNSVVYFDSVGSYYFLSFHTPEQRELFLKENLDLIEQYLML